MYLRRQEIIPSKEALEQHLKDLAEAQKIIREIFPQPQPYQKELKNIKPGPVVYDKEPEILDSE